MKIFLPLTILFISSLVQANCGKKVDPSKVVLFIDTNESDLEIIAAEKAACERGERVVVVPKNYKMYKTLLDQITKAKKALNKCTANCEELSKKYKESETKYSEYRSSQKSIPESTKEALSELKDNKAKVQSILISGHDGGGSFGAAKGYFTREELGNIIEKFREVDDVRSLMLLGCYTGVQQEITEWNRIFPKVKMIAGYDLAGPLSTTVRGHEYITEMLTKEKNLYSSADASQLNRYMSTNLKALHDLNAAVYLKCGEENTELYYASAERRKGFSKIDIGFCEDKAAKIKDMLQKLALYTSGEIEPPLDTQGEVRKLYNTAREVEHCKQHLPSGFSANNVFNLLFYKDVKQNYAKFYADDLIEAEKKLGTITIEEFEKNTNEEIAGMEKRVKEENELTDLLEKSPDEYKVLKEKEIAPLRKEANDLITSHPFLKEIIAQNFTPAHLSEKKMKILQQYYSVSLNATYLEQTLANEIKNTSESVKRRREATDLNKQGIKLQQERLQEFKGNPERLKEIWVPTADNLKTKSRKELLQNLHNINGILAGSGLNPEQRKALSWMNASASTHLQYFQNPFSWHEVTSGPAEAPPYPIRLESMTSYGGGYTGGYVGGGLGGGGYIQEGYGGGMGGF